MNTYLLSALSLFFKRKEKEIYLLFFQPKPCRCQNPFSIRRIDIDQTKRRPLSKKAVSPFDLVIGSKIIGFKPPSRVNLVGVALQNADVNGRVADFYLLNLSKLITATFPTNHRAVFGCEAVREVFEIN